MVNKFSKKESEEIISKALDALGLSENMLTDPVIMRAVIKEMKLDDFECSDNIFDLKEIQAEAKKFNPLFIDIKKGLVNDYPAMIEFLDLALKKGWLKKTERAVKSAHILFLLEYLTSSVCNSDTFFDEIHAHYELKESKYGIDLGNPIKALPNLYRMCHSFFTSIKILTIDPIMILINSKFRDFKLSEKELKNYYINQKLSYFEYQLLKNKRKIKSFVDLVNINIYEAGITDYNQGFKANSLCAEALTEEMSSLNPKDIKYKEMLISPVGSSNPFYNKLSKNYSMDFPLSKRWQSLYVSWNMAFILAHLDNLDMLIPKLLIPSILNVKSSQFIEARLVSLWLSICFYICRLEDNNTLPQPKNRIEMSQEFGKINKKYAIELAKKDLNESERVFKRKYYRFFSHKYRNFFKTLMNCF